MNTQPAGCATVVPTALLVEAGLRRVATAIRTVAPPPPGDVLAHAARARRLAELHARRARWWTVLERDIVGNHDLPMIYAQAAYAAVAAAEREARFWTDTAEDWTARAEQRPTSDVAGAMSNWHELGLTAPPNGLPATGTGLLR